MQVLESSDGPLMYQLKHLGAAECHFAYRMVVVMMRRDMPMPKVSTGGVAGICPCACWLYLQLCAIMALRRCCAGAHVCNGTLPLIEHGSLCAVVDAQVLHLWEVLWAYSCQQRRCADKEAAEPAAAANGKHVQAVSPSKGSAAAPETGQNGSGDNRAAAGPTGSPKQLWADGRFGSPDGKGDIKTKGSSVGTVESRSSLQQQPHLDLFICFLAAVIQSQRRTLLDHCYNADDVLRLFHGVRRIDLWQCLDKAHTLLGKLKSSSSAIL